MLKKHILKHILISTGALFMLLVVYLIPNEEPLIKVDVEMNYKKRYVYLLNDNNLLSRSSVVIDADNMIDEVAELIDVLIIGGKKESSIPNGFRSLLPSETKLNGVIYENRILKLDFNAGFLDTIEDMETSYIESILYTLTELEDVDGISISIDGVILNKLPKSNINIPSIIKRDFGINKKYDITSISGITKVIEYYISEYNDSHYYVPVTKYTNDSSEKIKIIIEDMISSNIYDTSLMSYINSNTKLLKTNIVNDTMELFFNSYILNDFDSKDILEEVIETISLSVKDNYDVNNVLFYVDDLEIYKSVLKTLE